mgnify:FL=1
MQPAMSLCVRHRGQIILERAIGHSHGNSPGSPEHAPRQLATPRTPFNFFSGSKAVTAMLVHHLDDEGVLHLDDAVADFVPEFARHGKQDVTIRHLVNHRAGMPTTDDRIDLDVLLDSDAIRQLYCDARLRSVPGRRVAYHAVSAGFVLADVIQAVTGMTINDYLTKVVREPMGMTNFTYGVPEDRVGEVARDAFTGFAQLPVLDWIMKRGFGGTMEEVVELARDPRFLRAVVPSGNIIATAEEVGRFFEMLLRGGTCDDVRVFDERTVRRATRETAYGVMDEVLMLPVRYGQGFMLGADVASLYGLRTPRAFGHLGFTNILGWADPDRDLSVGFMNSGKPLITPELVLWLGIMQTISARIPRVAR